MNILYRNFIESRGLFYNGEDTHGLYNVADSLNWYEAVKGEMKTIAIKRPMNKFIEIKIPIKKLEQGEKVEEDDSLIDFITNNNVEPLLAMILGKVLDSFFMGVDGFFYKRKKKKQLNKKDAGVIFNMRELLEGMSRTSPIQMRTGVDKETQALKVAPRTIGKNLKEVEFPYKGKRYKTNLYGVYGPIFRKAMLPNSNFEGSPLQRRQREYFIKRGRITICIASRSIGKSFSNIVFVGEYLFKELNIAYEFDRPFLIVYAGLSSDQNMQVVQYIKAMAKRLTSNTKVLKRVNSTKTLTLYDGENERNIRFVSQGQEGGGFLGSRPHLVIIDEAARHDERTYTIASGVGPQVQIVLISTIKQTDRMNWFYKLYLKAKKQQKHYKSPEELTCELWIKHGMHRIKTQEEYEKKVSEGVIEKMRMDYWKERPLVGLMYDLDEAECYTEEEKKMMVAGLAATSEEDALAEFYCEYSRATTIFPTDGILDGDIPEYFDKIAYGFDEAESHDNPAIVFVGMKGTKVFVLHSEILDRDSHINRYGRIAELENEFKRKTQGRIIFTEDLTRTQGVGLREVTQYHRKPDFPVEYTSSNKSGLKEKRPFYLIGKKALVDLSKNQFFKTGIITFDEKLDIEGGLIEECANFKKNKSGKIQGVGKTADDQVNAMLLALMGLYYGYVDRNFKPTDLTGATQSVSVIQARQNKISRMQKQKEEIRRKAKIMSQYW